MPYTPGPWEAEHGVDGFYFVTYDDGRDLHETENGDNAALIAAAPDLLDALRRQKEIVRQLLRNHTHSLPDGFFGVEEAVDAALAKAVA